jgi:hypothetical protein
MARRILDFDGTVVAAGGAYPFGDIKDNPSGTRINRKSNADIQQFFQKLMNGAGITANSLADNTTNGYQLTEAMSKVIGNHAAQIVVSLIGGTYDPTKVYILWGCATRADSGFAMYDGELYYIQGNAGSPCGGALVDIVTVFSPVLYTNGVQTLQIACGTSGTGIANFANVIYLQTGYVALTSDDATWIDNPGDAPKCRRFPTGKIQLSGGFEVASSPADFQFGSIPSGFRPYKDISAVGVKEQSGTYSLVALLVTPAGKISFRNASDTNTSGRIQLDSIQYDL